MKKNPTKITLKQEELIWDKLFAKTQKRLARMAKQAEQEDILGKTKPLRLN